MKKGLVGKKIVEKKIKPKLLTGTTADKFPILLDDGKTIIFISDKSKEAEIRQKYKLQDQLRYSK